MCSRRGSVRAVRGYKDMCGGSVHDQRDVDDSAVARLWNRDAVRVDGRGCGLDHHSGKFVHAEC